MTLQPEQKLFERQRFTRVLERICVQLDRCATFEVEAKDRYEKLAVIAGKAPPVERQTIANLWVAGSYARGAALCGDLDVVIQVTKDDGRMPRFSTRRLIRKAFGSTPDVSYYFGTPTENSSGVPFEESRLIWTLGMDWRAAMAALSEQPGVARFSRDTDVLPLRPQQLGNVDYIDSVIERHAREELAFRWIRYEPVHLGTLRDPEAQLLRITEHWGKKTRDVLPFALQYLRQHLFADEEIDSARSEARTIEGGGIYVALGQPTPNHLLLDTPGFTRVTLIPHLSRRGPNGAWEISRGPKHEIDEMFAETSAYLLAYSDCIQPHTFEYVEGSVSRSCLELFLSREAAEEGLRDLAELMEGDEDGRQTQTPRSPYQLTGGIAIIPAALVTGLNSDLPGDVTAMVTENVYDSATGRHLLIPQGSWLHGEYDSEVLYGQRRVLMVWTRLTLPDSASIVLDRLKATDVSGYSGLEDDVDWHGSRIFAGAVASTLLGVGAELASPERSGNEGAVVIAAGESVQDTINQVGKEITRRNLDIQPTLSVRPGFPLRVLVNRDLILRPYEG